MERSVVVSADEAHEIDGGGAPVACLWLEPSGGGERRLEILAAENAALERDFRALFEQNGREGKALLRDLHAFARPREGDGEGFDPRVAEALARLMRRPDEALPVASHARAAGVSPSQFQRLFTRAAKAPFRRYRGWLRLMAAVMEVRGGASLTAAAHAAGFADLAHFSRSYRAAFGAPPSGLKVAATP